MASLHIGVVQPDIDIDRFLLGQTVRINSKPRPVMLPCQRRGRPSKLMQFTNIYLAFTPKNDALLRLFCWYHSNQFSLHQVI
jgi:hypothetical protein